MLDNPAIHKGKGFAAGDLYFFKKLSSTSTYLSAHIDSHQAGDVIVAAHQSDGRGRSGRHWLGSTNKNLTFTILHRTPEQKAYWPNLGQAAALALAELLSQYTTGITLKWPNDVLCNDRKIAGLLPEVIHSQGKSWILMGIGINVNMTAAETAAINAPATSLLCETGKKAKLPPILQRFFQYYATYYNTAFTQGFAPLIEKWNNYFKPQNKQFYYHQGEKKVKVNLVCTREDGSLDVRLDGKLINLKWGELTAE